MDVDSTTTDPIVTQSVTQQLMYLSLPCVPGGHSLIGKFFAVTNNLKNSEVIVILKFGSDRLFASVISPLLIGSCRSGRKTCHRQISASGTAFGAGET